MNIPIAHISGGDITEGAIDNQIRNAVTMMSTYHFSGTEESAERIFRMTNSKNNVYITGETNLDNFRKLPKWDRTKLATSLNINKNKKWVLCTYHSETKLTIEENLKRVDNLLSFFEIHQELEIIVTKANSDLGGVEINEKFTRASKELSNVHLFNSLGQHRYISILSQIKFMIGNSSSGIFETPILRVPVINIGNRQKGRKTPNNIINVDGSLDSISNAFFTVESEEYKSSLESIVNPYGDGHASERIVQILKVL
jgi:GDP/UDP-N,N'-diacetylbacillosamine 2-epimerase (hydrolysing)